MPLNQTCDCFLSGYQSILAGLTVELSSLHPFSSPKSAIPNDHPITTDGFDVCLINTPVCEAFIRLDRASSLLEEMHFRKGLTHHHSHSIETAKARLGTGEPSEHRVIIYRKSSNQAELPELRSALQEKQLIKHW